MNTTLSPVCTSCQSPLGYVYPTYYRILAKRIKDTLDRKGYSYEDIWDNLDTEMDDVLTQLGVTYMCCRKSLMSHNRIVKGAV